MPQDPADEPASLVLERLRQQSAAAKFVRRGRRTAHEVQAAPPARDPPGRLHHHRKKGERPGPPRGAPNRPRYNELIAVLRAVVSDYGPCDRATVIRQTANPLGYQRVGKMVASGLDNAIRTAVRRCVLINEGEELRVNRASISEMEADDRDFMKNQFLAAISQDGRAWVERDEAPRLLSSWFGFHRAGPQIQETAKSLINGLLHEHRLEAEGTCIRRAVPSRA